MNRNKRTSPLKLAVEQRDEKTLEMVHEAIEHNNTLLAYQPIMLSSDPQKVAFYECLIRVIDATGRIIPAKEFIDVIEDTELGRKIDALALNMALKTLHENPSLRLSVNMSTLSIGYRHWNRNLKRWLERDETIGERLIIEITERSAVGAPNKMRKFMEELQSVGVCFALDDFGSGHASLGQLMDFYFDILKIDGSFIKSIDQDPDKQVLVDAMVKIAQHFQMLTVAEIIETREEAEVLMDLGVDCMQGYFFGPPTVRPAWNDSMQQNKAS